MHPRTGSDRALRIPPLQERHLAAEKTPRSLMAQGIYGTVIGLVCLAAIPYDLPLTAVALVPAIMALGFGGMHIRDAILARRAEAASDQSSHSLR